MSFPGQSTGFQGDETQTAAIIEEIGSTISDDVSASCKINSEAVAPDRIGNELWAQAENEKEQLFALMEIVKSRLDKKAKNQDTSLDLRHCNWEQVMKSVQDTSQRSKGTSAGAKTMHYISKLGRYSGAFEKWLELLPQGDYGASICGAFKLAVGAAGQYVKVEEAIFEALTSIPETMDNARKYVQIYADFRDSSLERKTFDLFLSILRALIRIMRFFADSTIRKLYEPLIKQTSYKSDLLASIETIKKHATRIKEEAEQCLARRVLGQGTVLAATQANSEQALCLLQSIYKMLSEGSSWNTTKTENTITNADNRGLGATTNCRRALDYNVLNRQADNRDREAASIDAAHHLLELIQYDNEIVNKDTAACLRLRQVLNDGSMSRAASAIRNARFKAHLSGLDTSSSLLINGRVDMGATDDGSPLSLVVARLAQIAEQVDSAFVVKFFCGEHRPGLATPVSCTPVGLMGSLVGQLVSQMLDKGVEINLAFLTRVGWENLEKLKLNILCTIFYELSLQLPAGSVLLCLVDEISVYETAQLENDTLSVIKKLTRLAAKHDETVFKLLVTCQSRAVGVSKYFVGRTVDLDEEIEIEDSASWLISNMRV